MDNELFTLTSEGTANVLALKFPPHLDSSEFDRINEAVLQVLNGHAGARWIIDLSAQGYMGSALLGMMINVRQHVLMAGGRIVLCGLSPQLSRVFRTCCLEQLFTIRHTRSEAVRAADY